MSLIYESYLMAFKTIDKPVSVSMTLHAPHNRRYDIDNRVKAVFDSLTHAGVWFDDSQVVSMIVVKGCSLDNGALEMTIKQWQD